jgi:putative membrane protein
MMYYRGFDSFGRCFSNWGWNSGYMNSGWGILMMVGTLIVAALIVVLIIALIKKNRSGNMRTDDQESLDMLNDRFVRGEISEEEYLKIKKILRSK